MQQCMKPCHDCPFRKDTIPWLSTEDVVRNTQLLLSANQNHACHHTMWDKYGQPNKKLADPIMCAGFLALREKEGLPSSEEFKAVKNTHQVFDSIRHFKLAGECADQSVIGRQVAFLANQPKRERVTNLTE